MRASATTGAVPVSHRDRTLLERNRAVSAARDAIDAAANGHGVVLGYSGPLGVGRSAMLREAGRLARGAGAVVLSARCDPEERELPFGVVLQLFESYVLSLDAPTARSVFAGRARFAATVLPAPGADREDLRFRPEDTMLVVHALYRLTANVAAVNPTVLLVDDVQWADSESLRFLRFLAPRLAELPASLIVTACDAMPAGSEETVFSLLGPKNARAETLAPLNERSVRTLVARRVGRCSARTGRTCHQLTRGNPMLVEALVAATQESGLSLEGKSLSELSGQAAGSVHVRALGARLAAMPPEARAVAEAVAVLRWVPRGRRLERLTGLSSEQMDPALDQLVRAGILRRAGTIAFAHPLVQTAVYAQISPSERTRMHGRAADALRDEGADVSQIASHLLRTRAGVRPWAPELLRTAAARAFERGTPERATALLRRALEERVPEDLRAGIMVDLGRAEIEFGRNDRAIQTLRQAATEAVPEQRGAATLELARALHLDGKSGEAAALLDRAMRESADEDVPERGRLKAAWLSIALVDPQLRKEASERIRQRVGSEAAADPHLAASAAAHLALEADSREHAITLAESALAEQAVADDPAAWAAALQALCWSGELKRVRILIAHRLARRSVQSSPRALLAARLASAHTAHLAGSVRDAERDLAVVETLLAAGAESDYLDSVPARRAAVLLERGKADEAQAALEGGLGPASPGDPVRRAQLLSAQSRVHAAHRRHAQALDAAVKAGALLADAGIENPLVVPWRSRAAHTAVALGRKDEALGFAREELQAAERFGGDAATGLALCTLAAASSIKQATELLVEAEPMLRDSGANLEHVRCLAALGSAMRRRGSRKQARAVLRRAQHIASRLGLTAIEAVARSELRLAGGRQLRKAPTGVGALTASERRVAELAAMGLTNREIAEQLFVTKKTVEWHLHNTFRKLEVESRTELLGVLGGANGDNGERKNGAVPDVHSADAEQPGSTAPDPAG